MRLIICLMMFSKILFGQEEEMTRIMEDQADQDEVREAEEDLIYLRNMLSRPVNINKATAEEMQAFPFLSSLHIEQLILYRKYTGILIDVKELQAVPGWDVQLVRKLVPYITVKEVPDLREKILESINKGSHQFLFRSSLSKNAGLLMRYRFRSPGFEWGINFEKDAGEKIWQSSKGPAFLSGHALIRNTGIVKLLVIGDYIVNIGQGLSLWQGRAVRKTSMPIMIKRQLPTLMPYRSNDENRYFRGLATVLVKKNLESAFFVSENRLDANTEADPLTGARMVRSFLNTGYHRDASELADKNSVALRSAGGLITVKTKRSQISMGTILHLFSLPVNRIELPYNKYAFRGRWMRNHSMNVHHTWRNMHFFGEMAIDQDGDPAVMGGVMMAVDTRIDLSFLVRKISKGYRSFFANAFTELSEPANEDGIYTGMSFRFAQGLVLDAFADHYRFPWVRYRADAPGWGRDYMLQLNYKPDKRTQLYIRYRDENKMENLGSSVIKTVGFIRKRSLRFHLQYKISPEWEWRFRIEGVFLARHGMGAESGYLFYSDWFWNPAFKPFGLSLRTMFCETGSYATRIYSYENDVMYYNIVPGFYGTQGKIYINGRLNMTKTASLFLKISRSFDGIGNNWQTRVQFIYGLP